MPRPRPARSRPPGLLLRWAGLALASACASPAAPPPAPERAADAGAQAGQATATVAPAQHRPGLRTDRVMVRPAPGAALDAVAADHGSRVVQPPENSPYAALAVPAGTLPEDFLVALVADPRIAGGQRESRFTGAGWDPGQAADPLRLHRTLSGAEHPAPAGIETIVVAVIDSGIALPDPGDAAGAPVSSARSLGTSALVAPWDWVDGDDWPQDAHQHGTHMASLIASDGTGGAIGMAPGVGLMPLRVLDADNLGSELDLVDAIHHATAHGADLINLSVAFWPDYLPSPALLEAIEAADAAGVVLVGAAGNHGLDRVSWPAASPLVLAVGSVCLDTAGALRPAPYSNRGPEVDLLAPGGCLDRDANGDGLLDGVVAETLTPSGDGTGLYAWAGTSQATAVVSGAAARLLAAGSSPAEARQQLIQSTLLDVLPGASHQDHWAAGLGTGRLALGGAEARPVEPGQPVLGALLPYLAPDAAGRPQLTVRASVAAGATGAPVPGAWVGIDLARPDAAGRMLHCRTDATGTCTVRDESAPVQDDDALTLRMEVVAVEGTLVRPGSMLVAVDGLSLLADALAETGAETGTADAAAPTLLGLRWETGEDDVMGEILAATSYLELTAGTTRPPTALLFGPAALPPGAADQLAVGDRGSLALTRNRLDGAGLASSPLGVTGVDTVELDAAELLDSVLGYHPADAHTLTGSGLASSPLGYESGPVALATSTLPGGAPAEGGLGDQLRAGGWTTPSGFGARATFHAMGLGPAVPETVSPDASLGAPRALAP